MTTVFSSIVLETVRYLWLRAEGGGCLEWGGGSNFKNEVKMRGKFFKTIKKVGTQGG